MQHEAESTSLERLLVPAAVAVVGATETAGRPGRLVMEQLGAAGVTVYPVHPTRDTILGVPACRSIAEVPEGVDVAVVAVAAEGAVAATEACVAREIPFVVVLAGGFGEAGESGKALEHRLANAVAGSGTRLLGPNTLGLQVPASGMDTVFVEHAGGAAPGDPAVEAGGAPTTGVALISQSGSVAVEAVRRAAVTSFPLRSFIGLGNAVDLSAVDFIPHFAEDADATAVCIYLEHLGEGRRLLRAAAEASRRKPVFLLKAGRTAGGAAAVSSHTGRLAGSDRVVAGALRQYGIQRVTDDEELTDAACAVSAAPIPRGNRVAVVTPAGGYGVMATDFIEAENPRAALRPATLAEHTEAALKDVLLPFASTRNPVDLTAGVNTDAFVRSVEIVTADEDVDVVVVVAFFSPADIGDDLIPGLAAVAAATDKPIIVFTQDGPRTDARARAFAAAGLATFTSLPRAIRAARVLVERSDIVSMPTGPAPRPSLDATPAGAPATASSADGRPAAAAAEWLAALPDPEGPTEADVKALLEEYGVATPRRMVVLPGGRGEPGGDSPAAGADAAAGTLAPPFPGPYAVKVVSPRILHKTEAKALRLGVSAEGVATVVSELQAAFPGEAVLIEEMVADAVVQVIVGALLDADLGPALMLGAGGIYTEIFDDVSFRLIPCSRTDIRAMMSELRSAPILQGYRGVEVDGDALIESLAAIAALVADLGDRFAELDVNPLVFAGGRWVALDAKLVVSRAQ
ncbi:MAG: acetate--CoA ligase family protein [Planctomycetota bacterium]